ncbi:MAG: Clp protease N-terminal domain-containing protein [Bryobacteraceae bacterium]
MFERYTESARKMIFVARYEAGTFGACYIESEHLLLGLLREDEWLRERAPIDTVRAKIEKLGREHPRPPATENLPLSHESKRVLAHGAEESERLNHREVHCGHLAAGLLREGQCLGARLLNEAGVTLETVRERLTAPPVKRAPAIEWQGLPRVGALAQPLAALVQASRTHLWRISEAEAGDRCRGRDWTRKQALGHLIDLATAHHRWFAEALVEPRVTGFGYLSPATAAAQNYDLLPWAELVYLWHPLNGLLIHTLSEAPPERHEIPCRIGVEPPVSLAELARNYTARVEQVIGEILTFGDG